MYGGGVPGNEDGQMISDQDVPMELLPLPNKALELRTNREVIIQSLSLSHMPFAASDPAVPFRCRRNLQCISTKLLDGNYGRINSSSTNNGATHPTHSTAVHVRFFDFAQCFTEVFGVVRTNDLPPSSIN